MLLMEGLKSLLYHPLLLGDIIVLYCVHIDFIMDASFLEGLKKPAILTIATWRYSCLIQCAY